MWITDVGFLIYWSVIGVGLIPQEYGYQDYTNEYLVAWNASFIPLDLFISLTGIMSLYFYKKKIEMWKSLCLISLTLTFCSGLQAIAFWAIRQDYDWLWWAPNLFLMIYPLFYIVNLIKIHITHDRASK
jgi:hypothetical protein